MLAIHILNLAAWFRLHPLLPLFVFVVQPGGDLAFEPLSCFIVNSFISRSCSLTYTVSFLVYILFKLTMIGIFSMSKCLGSVKKVEYDLYRRWALSQCKTQSSAIRCYPLSVLPVVLVSFPPSLPSDIIFCCLNY